MNNFSKIMTIVGTRPEIIRLSRVIAKLNKYTDHILVHTGQNYDYELNKIFFDDFELNEPHHYLNSAGETVGETIARIIQKSDEILRKVKPDALLVLGDTNSCLSVIPAKRLKIPVFHMEAGNRCFDQRVPEEINRKIVDHTADINLPYSDIAREYLIREGLQPDRIIKTGSPMFEVINYNMKKIHQSCIMKNFSLEKDKYFVVSSHREENVDDPIRIKKLASILNLIAEKYELPIIMSTHPRTRKRIEENRLILNDLINLSPPLGFSDYIKLQINAKLVLSDSGTITEESSILKFPALNIRESHERPEGMEEGSVIMCGLEKERVLEAVDISIKQCFDGEFNLITPHDYTIPNVSDKVVRIILSYIDYINSNVWKKHQL